MAASSKTVRKLKELARERNREVVGEVALKVGLGVLFSLLTFGFTFWIGCLFGALLANPLGLRVWVVALAFAGAFMAAATWSAWRNVDPLRDVAPLSEAQQAEIAVGQAVGLGGFSPRHATAGFALVLIGGPASMLEGLGLWAARLRVDHSTLEAAAQLLEACEDRCPALGGSTPAAALLLRRLGLIKFVPDAGVPAFALTDRGYKIVVRRKKRETGTQ